MIINSRFFNRSELMGFIALAAVLFVILPLTYLGAVFIPITKYPDAVQPIARLNPLLYCIDGLRIGFLGRSDVSDVSLISAGAVIALSLAITISISLVALRRSTARCSFS